MLLWKKRSTCSGATFKTGMGRTLDSMDIHSPSLPQRMATTTAQSLNELIEEKIVLEGTLARLNSILESHGVGTRELDHRGLMCRHVDSLD